MEIAAMWNRGFPIGQISEAMGLNKEHVRDLVFDFIERGYLITRGQMRGQELRFALFMKEAGRSDAEIRAMFDMKQSTLEDWWRLARKNGVKASKAVPISLRSEEAEIRAIEKAYKDMYSFGGAYHPVTIACRVKVHPDRVREVLGDKA